MSSLSNANQYFSSSHAGFGSFSWLDSLKFVKSFSFSFILSGIFIIFVVKTEIPINSADIITTISHEHPTEPNPKS